MRRRMEVIIMRRRGEAGVNIEGGLLLEDLVSFGCTEKAQSAYLRSTAPIHAGIKVMRE